MGRSGPWAQLLRRVFAADVLACLCAGRRRLLAVVVDSSIARTMPATLGLPCTSVTFAPVYWFGAGPPQAEIWFDIARPVRVPAVAREATARAALWTARPRTSQGPPETAENRLCEAGPSIALAWTMAFIPRLHGPVLTHASTDQLADCIRRGQYNAQKVITAWGPQGPWTDAARAKVVKTPLVGNLPPKTIVRTLAGDGQYGRGYADNPTEPSLYPLPDKIESEIAPWYELDNKIYIEIGNEPNNEEGSGKPWGGGTTTHPVMLR